MRPVLLVFLLAVAACSSRSAHPASPPAPAAAPGTDLNSLLRASWADAKLEPAAPADDGEFLRRATLDIIGRVPTVDETRAFLADAAPDKRAALVDRLLASPEYATYWAAMYGDLLLGRELRLRGPFARQPAPRAFLEQAFAENRRWDALATDVLTATGTLADNGAVAYVASKAAKGGGADALAGTTARVFLGVQIQCAQCHDHPYDKAVKQTDFVAFAAYFAETRARREKDDGQKQISVIDRPIPKNPRARKRMAARLAAQGREVPAWATAEPRFLGRDVEPAADETRRQTLARAIVGSDLFAKAAVNRYWAYFLGAGLTDPWDDLGGENDPDHPATLRRLADDFTASGYDLRALIKQIVLSDAYARSSAGPAAGADRAEALFARARVRPLSADQIFASLLTATGIVEAGRGRFRGDIEQARERALREYLFTFPDDEMASVGEFTGSVAQALLLFNGDVANLGALALEGGVLGDTLAAATDPRARLDGMFLAVYARPARDDEARALLAYIAAHDGSRLAWEDAYFALLTSTEFLTNH